MTFGSLFAGIGGMDLGLERAGLECRWQVEIDDYATRVLERHWPGVRRWRNIKTFVPDTKGERFGAWGPGRIAARRERRRDSPGAARWRVDLIAGGFPCQDISYAGKGAGLSGKRSGLWYEFARVVRTLEPRYVLVENVAALLTRGLDAVLGTLASYGYDAEWFCLPATAVGAPHIRDRVFLVASQHSHAAGKSRGPQQEREHDGAEVPAGVRGEPEMAAHADRFRREAGWPNRNRDDGSPLSRGANPDGLSAVEIPGRGDDLADAQGSERRPVEPAERLRMEGGYGLGLQRRGPQDDAAFGSRREALADFRDSIGADQWGADPADDPESGVGRVAHGIPHRVDRLRGLGNAVVPQVAEWIGRRILESEGLI